MTTARKGYDGKPFGHPSPAPLTKAWRIKHGVLAPDPAPVTSAHVTERFHAAFTTVAAVATTTLLGQDSVGVTAMQSGLAVYCGYEGGTLGYRNGSYTTMPEVLRVFPGRLYVSVGRDAIDIEPGLASPGDGPGFVRGARPPHTSKPLVYCSAGDLRSVIADLSAAGISRSAYDLWSAHWIGKHICGPSTCGYPQCDATQYASNNSFDSDIFYSYCFGPPPPPPANPVLPLSLGALDINALGPVHTAQGNLNKWRTVLATKSPALAVDGSYGAATAAAVQVAQEFFKERGIPAGTLTQAVYNKLLGVPTATGGTVPPPPPPSPWVFNQVRDLKVTGAGPHSVGISFTSPVLVVGHLPIDSYEVAVVKGKSINGPVIASYPRHITSLASGTFGEQYGGVEPETEYTMGVRAQTNGPDAHSAPWSTVTFTTAKA